MEWSVAKAIAHRMNRERVESFRVWPPEINPSSRSDDLAFPIGNGINPIIHGFELNGCFRKRLEGALLTDDFVHKTDRQ